MSSDHSDFGHWGADTFSLEDALTTLADSDTLRTRLAKKFGTKTAQAMHAMMTEGLFTGDLGDTLQDYLTEASHSDAEDVWSASHTSSYYGSMVKWPIDVYHYCGIYWACTPEHDPVEFFLDIEDAKAFCMTWFDDVVEG
jgi:hypothetical protein